MTAYPTGAGSAGCCDAEVAELAAVVAVLADRPVTVHVRRVAAQVLSGHRLVVPQGNADGEVVYADNINPAHLNLPVWLTTDAWDAGATAVLVAYGVVTEPTWAWTTGAPLYLGTSGQLTETAPTDADAVFLLRLATALDSTTIFYDPGLLVAFSGLDGGYSGAYAHGYSADPLGGYSGAYAGGYTGSGAGAGGYVGGYMGGY